MDFKRESLEDDLDKAEEEKAIKEVAEEARDLGYEDIMRLAEEKLKALLAKAESAITTPASQISQVEKMGGSVAEINERTKDVDDQIAQVEADTASRIQKVTEETQPARETETVETPTETTEVNQEEIEKKKIMNDLIELKSGTELSKKDLYYQQLAYEESIKNLPEGTDTDFTEDLKSQIVLLEQSIKTWEEEYRKKLHENGLRDLDITQAIQKRNRESK